MKVTVCQLNGHSLALEKGWETLADQVRREATDMVLLPEMPFYPWFPEDRDFDAGTWEQAVAAHEHWLSRLDELAPARVLGSRPVQLGERRLNEGFVWDSELGYRPAHTKVYLPDEDGFWEASWYRRGERVFAPIQAGPARIGFLICTELWFMQHARDYGQAGIHILATPRATLLSTVEKWVTAGRAAAIISGAFSLSSNHAGQAEKSTLLGGRGWVINPEGDVLALTSEEQPVLTVEIDLAEADQAKQTYPRYVQS